MAKTLDVLLTKNIHKLGAMGDVVTVKSGYARNFLLPSASAVLAGTAAKRQIEILRERAQVQFAEAHSAAESQKKQFDGMSIQIEANVSHDDQLFGSVGIRDIIEALAKSGVRLNSKQINLHDSIRKLGTYSVTIELVKDVTAQITVEVLNSNPDAAGMDEVLAETVEVAEASE